MNPCVRYFVLCDHIEEIPGSANLNIYGLINRLVVYDLPRTIKVTACFGYSSWLFEPSGYQLQCAVKMQGAAAGFHDVGLYKDNPQNFVTFPDDAPPAGTLRWEIEIPIVSPAAHIAEILDTEGIFGEAGTIIASYSFSVLEGNPQSP